MSLATSTDSPLQQAGDAGQPSNQHGLSLLELCVIEQLPLVADEVVLRALDIMSYTKPSAPGEWWMIKVAHGPTYRVRAGQAQYSVSLTEDRWFNIPLHAGIYGGSAVAYFLARTLERALIREMFAVLETGDREATQTVVALARHLM